MIAGFQLKPQSAALEFGKNLIHKFAYRFWKLITVIENCRTERKSVH